MSSTRFTKHILLAISAIFLSVASPFSSPTTAEIIDLDLSGITVAFEEGDEGLTPAAAQRFVQALRRAEAFWDARVLGYSNTLPRQIQGGLTGGLLILSSNADLDDGILGSAGPETTFQIVRGGLFRGQQYAVPAVSAMEFDNEFLETLTEDEVTDLCIHEMGHALGIGSLWAANGLIERVAGRGPLQYHGTEARRAYAIETGVAGLARTGFVPIEQQGGGGTALGHWEDDDPFFNSIARNNRIEIMTGTMIPGAECFLSRTSLASLVDIHYVVRGFNEDELIQFPRVLANSLAPSNPLNASQRLTGFSSNPFGANRALKISNTATKSRTTNMYKKRRK